MAMYSTLIHSYGLPPLETEIINFLDNHSSSWRYNRQRKVYIAKFADLTVSSHCMLLLEDTIYRNIFNKISFQWIIIETIEMYHCGLNNSTEIYTVKCQRLPTNSKKMEI